MRYLLFFLLIITGLNQLSAQNDSVPVPPQGWNKKGSFNLLFNQSAFSNWVPGGQNSLSGTAGLIYELNYLKGDITWDNKITAAYGLNRTSENRFYQKTDDRLELNSILGKKAYKNWYYSAFMDFKTQFARGYDFGTDSITGLETRTVTTHIFSPGYLTAGLGMLWKKNDNFKINISPISVRFIFVDDAFTSVPGYVDGDYFGVDANRNMRFELGATLFAYYKFVALKNVNIENIFIINNSNYLEDPQNIDLDYQLNIVMTINEYMSTNLNFQAVYDDNAFEGFQLREVFGLSVNFNW